MTARVEEPVDPESEDPWLCADCIGEAWLKEEVRRTGEARRCTSCKECSPAISLEELANRVESAFETHFYRTTDQPDGFQWAMMKDPELDYDFEREGEPILWAIAGAAQVSEEIAQAVLDILSERHSDFESAAMGEETEFDPESYYAQRGPNDIEYQLDWRALERSIKEETRFFNKVAEAVLDRIFDGAAELRSLGGSPVIRTAGPEGEFPRFYRARVFHRDDRLEAALARPDRELGPPPSAIAPGGRMNARGVSLFYGATGRKAALAEVRPPVGARTLVGRFNVSRPLRLLDIDALRTVYVEGSVFDPTYMGRLERGKFLSSLSDRITLPVMPDDEASEYLITQVIADYLASNSALDLDGLLYPSVQRRGKHQNVVLFRRASRVAALDLPEGSEVTANLEHLDEDGPYPSYWVSEVVPVYEPGADAPKEPGIFPSMFLESARPYWDPFTEPDDDRDPALSVDAGSLEVHHIRSVRVRSEKFGVARHRQERRVLKPVPLPDDDPF